jgi:hypothetical protein
MSVFEYIERVLDVHAPLSWEPSEWAAPASAASHTRADGTLAGDLEHAMRVQRAFPWWRMRGHVEALGRQPAVVWSIDGEQLVRFSAQGPVDAGGEAVEVADGGLLRVAHPASMTPAERERWRGVLEALGLTPPFVQLERPVFVEGEGEVWKPGDRMEIHPDVFYEVAWEDSPFSDDYIEERVLRLPGAPWYAVATHDYRDSYLGGIYGGEDGYHIESVRLVSVLDHREYGARDAVAFSEVQLALREVAEVSARLRAQAE